ncbi:hypothetical protein EPN15_00160 [Patescibacteria group bacterium]|nr:MAG: hypothetical protein EPN15_00160 [Patescibacteria group bacterium]
MFDAESEIHCPICKKMIEKKLDGITHIDLFVYQCDDCGLKFGAASKDGGEIRCPVCFQN